MGKQTIQASLNPDFPPNTPHWPLEICKTKFRRAKDFKIPTVIPFPPLTPRLNIYRCLYYADGGLITWEQRGTFSTTNVTEDRTKRKRERAIDRKMEWELKRAAAIHPNAKRANRVTSAGLNIDSRPECDVHRPLLYEAAVTVPLGRRNLHNLLLVELSYPLPSPPPFLRFLF